MRAISRHRRTLLLVPAILLVFATAWFTGRQVAVSTSDTTRLYDVSELVTDFSNYDAPSLALVGGARRRQGGATTTAPTTAARVDGLVRLIRASVDPESWNQSGRSVVGMSRYVAVSHTPRRS